MFICSCLTSSFIKIMITKKNYVYENGFQDTYKNNLYTSIIIIYPNMNSMIRYIYIICIRTMNIQGIEHKYECYIVNLHTSSIFRQYNIHYKNGI